MTRGAFRPDASLLPLMPPEMRAQFEERAPADPFADHVHFTAEQSSKGWAVYHQPKPIRQGANTVYGLRVPLFQIFDGLVDPKAIAQRAARILNSQWYAQEDAA